MKYRIGWVTNSSSSMYIMRSTLGMPDATLEEILEAKFIEACGRDPKAIAKHMAKYAADQLKYADNETGLDYVVCNDRDRVLHAYGDSRLVCVGHARNALSSDLLSEEKRKEAAELCEKLALELYGKNFMKRRYYDVIEEDGKWYDYDEVGEIIQDNVDLNKIREINKRLSELQNEFYEAYEKKHPNAKWNDPGKVYLPSVDEEDLEPVVDTEVVCEVDYNDHSLANLLVNLLGAKER